MGRYPMTALSVKVLRVGFNTNNRAIVDRSGDRLVGPAPRLAEEICKLTGLILRPVIFENARRLVEGAASEWDIAFLAVDPSRSDRIEFSAPYLEIEATFLCRSTVTERSCADIIASGQKILSATGASYDNRLSKVTNPGLVISARSPAEALAYFRDGRADVLAGIRSTLERDALPDTAVLSDAFSTISQAVGLSSQARHLLPQVNQAVANFLQTAR